jgi:hypothetical protein
MADQLEAPGSDAVPEWSSLYRARGDEVTRHRPEFTGDVFADVSLAGEDQRKTLIILQHPCAIRTDGVALMSRLLVAEVIPDRILRPSQWADGHYKQLPLVELRPDENPAHFAAFFTKHYVATPAELRAGTRIACMSQRGVNLLLQRWVHHNSRVIVATQRYQEVSAPQFEEADMTEDWCMDREEDGVPLETAAREVDQWLSEKDSDGVSRRDQLKDEQQRGELRRALRAHLRLLRQGTAVR